MPTVARRGPARQTYLALIRRFPLKPIRSARQLAEAHGIVNVLMDRNGLTVEERDYLQVLSQLVEEYEEGRFPMDAVSGSEMLAHLIETKGMTQVRLAKETGIAESTISEIIAGKRDLGLSHIRKLSEYFKVDPGLFI